MKKAVRDIPAFTDHVRSATYEELQDAKRQIHRHHHVQHEILDEEIKSREAITLRQSQAGAQDQAERHHQENRRWMIISVIAAVISALAALGSFLSQGSLEHEIESIKKELVELKETDISARERISTLETTKEAEHTTALSNKNKPEEDEPKSSQGASTASDLSQDSAPTPDQASPKSE